LQYAAATDKYLTRQQPDCTFDRFRPERPSVIGRAEASLGVARLKSSGDQVLHDVPVLDRFEHGRLLKPMRSAVDCLCPDDRPSDLEATHDGHGAPLEVMKVHQATGQHLNDRACALNVVTLDPAEAGQQIACAYDRVDLIDRNERRPCQTHHPEHAANEFRVRWRRLEKSKLSSLALVNVEALQPAIG
jgi:hypothetical protein